MFLFEGYFGKVNSMVSMEMRKEEEFRWWTISIPPKIYSNWSTWYDMAIHCRRIYFSFIFYSGNLFMQWSKPYLVLLHVDMDLTNAQNKCLWYMFLYSKNIYILYV
jgi:hypothetical protein